VRESDAIIFTKVFEVNQVITPTPTLTAENQNCRLVAVENSTFWSGTILGYPMAPFDDRGNSSKSDIIFKKV
jgi:hypothetical protein